MAQLPSKIGSDIFRSGHEAKKLFDEAQVMLKTIIVEELLEARAVIGFYPAVADGDDVLVWEDEQSALNGCPHK